jgi:Fis family transcriptional regulator, factor for inversion stimulation protein
MNNPTVTPTISLPQVSNCEPPATIDSCIRSQVARYFTDLEGHQADGTLYTMVLGEMERPLLDAVLNYCNGNQSRAAIILGINRATLRKKLHTYNLINSR